MGLFADVVGREFRIFLFALAKIRIIINKIAKPPELISDTNISTRTAIGKSLSGI